MTSAAPVGFPPATPPRVVPRSDGTDLAGDAHVMGVTTNPTIFRKAISSSDHYDRQVRDLAAQGVDAPVPGRGHQRQRHADLLPKALRRGDGRLRRRHGARRAAGRDLTRLASVASFLVSRIDTEIDQGLDAIGSVEAKALRGMAAIANARLAFQASDEVFTIRGDTIRRGYDDAAAVMAALAAVGVDYDDVVDTLEQDGLTTFRESWAALAETLRNTLMAAKRGRNEDDLP